MASLPHGRTPPHNLDAERSLLCGILLTSIATEHSDQRGAVREVSGICGPPDFYRDAHRKVFEAMLSLHEDGIRIDRISLKDRLSERGDLEAVGGDEFIEMLDKLVPNATNLAYYAKIVRDKARARRMIEAGTSIAQLGYEAHGDVADFLAESEKRVHAVLDGAPRGNRYLQSHTRFTTDELMTEPPPLPFILRPYLQAQTVSVLSGGGGSGKTALLMLLALSRALGRSMFKDLIPTEGETVVLTTEDRKIHYRQKLAALREQFGVEFDVNARQIADRIHLLDMAGLPVRLIAAERGEQFMPTVEIELLAEALKAKAPKADHVIIETISRVTGGIESNPAMTVLVNACEHLCLLANVAVTLVGHVGQNTGRAGIADAYAARGGSALGDNARSSMVLAQLSDKNKNTYAPGLDLSDEDLHQTLAWVHPKSNGAPPAKPMLLRKLSTRFGMVLVDADFSDVPRKTGDSAARKKKGTAMKYDELKIAVVEYVEAAQKPVSRNEVLENIGGKAQSFYRAVKDLIADHLIATDSDDKLIPGTTREPPQGTTPATGGSHPPVPPTVLPSGGTEGSGGNQLPLLPGSSGSGEAVKKREAGNHLEEIPTPTDKDAPPGIA